MPALSADQLILIARQHLDAGRIAPARDLCHLVLRDQPNRADAKQILARASGASGASGAAGVAGPVCAIGHFNLGNNLFDEDRIDNAIAAYQTAIDLQPDFAEAHSNLGNAWTAKSQTARAIAAYDEAIRLKPSLPQPRWNRALAALLLGDFETGWAGYEWRHHRFTSPPRDAPQWTGESLAGKTILLWAEQGFGDTIQFVRYFDNVAALAGNVLLEVPPEFRRLLAGPSGNPAQSSETNYDFHISLLSLPRIFKTRAETIPCHVSYLKAPLDLIDRWRTRLGEPTGKFRVGLAWAGRAAHQHDRKRSVSLATLAPLGKIAGVEFHSLQPDQFDSSNALGLIDHATQLTDFADTAALIANLDLVISVDTAVAHLAGALGKPTWLLLAFAPDWRWQLKRTDSPWYPTMRLFRQSKGDDWTDPIAAVASALQDKRPRTNYESTFIE